jgi:hypothetical protein
LFIFLKGGLLVKEVEKYKQVLYKFNSGGKMEKEFSSVSIPTSLYKKIEEKIEGTEFSSVSGYVTKVLRESLAREEENKEVFTAEEEEKIKEKLKALGYID